MEARVVRTYLLARDVIQDWSACVERELRGGFWPESG